MALEIKLGKDRCQIYKECHKGLKPSVEWSVLDLANSKMNPTAKNRLNYSLKNGYSSKIITWNERNSLLDSIFEINNSSEIRQGKEMTSRYKSYPKIFVDYHDCDSHKANFIGCFKDGKLVGYATLLFCGEIAVVTDILGHAVHLRNACMLNLWAECVNACRKKELKYIIYGKADDGTEGLKYWKYSVGLKANLIKEIKANSRNLFKSDVFSKLHLLFLSKQSRLDILERKK